jgi:hypothetical protein
VIVNVLSLRSSTLFEEWNRIPFNEMAPATGLNGI